jgi:hypothetical protein
MQLPQRIQQDVLMPVEHPVERPGSKRLRQLVPVRQMHAAPERQVGLKIVDRGRPRRARSPLRVGGAISSRFSPLPEAR